MGSGRHSSLNGYGWALLFIILAGCHRQKPIFREAPSAQTGISFVNQLIPHDSLNILDYLYYYNGAGVAIGDINNDGLPDIYFNANQPGHNKLYLNKGGFLFQDITEKAGVAGTADWCTGVTMADVNGDGWLDIYVCSVNGKLGLQGANQLFINNRDGTFTDSAKAYGLAFTGYSTQAVFFDYDHDGDLDCFLLNQSAHSVETFGDTANRRIPSYAAGDKLYRNDGKPGKPLFRDVTASAGIYSSALGYGLGVSVADLNNDGWEDIYVGNDFHENDYYYINDRHGGFTESGAAHFNHYSRFSMGNDIADIDNDGQPDIFTADMLPEEESVLKTYSSGERADVYNLSILQQGFQAQYSRNSLQKNLGNGAAFSEQALMSGVAATDWSWSPLIADFDNDGLKDIFVSNGIVKRPVDLDYMKFISSNAVSRMLNGSTVLDSAALSQMPDGKAVSYLFRGEADGHFTNVSNAWGIRTPAYANGAAYGDLNNDGNLDLVVNNINMPASVYINQGRPGSHYLSIACKGDNKNTSGIGTKIYLFCHGKLQYQQLMTTRGFESSSEPGLHFGLDTATAVDSLLVVWPDQRFQLLKKVRCDQRLDLFQQQAGGSYQAVSFFPAPPPLLRDISDSVHLSWIPKEDDRHNSPWDFPQFTSRYPALAVADVNKDGFDDLYFGASIAQPAQLFLGTPEGGFVLSPDTVFQQSTVHSESAALFFDANGDGSQDLIVLTDGNNEPDRLYLNDGKGHFALSAPGIPYVAGRKTVVLASDVDHDGDLDLFIAVNQLPGQQPASYILYNNGKGVFKQAPAAPFAGGAITAAVFADLDGDGWEDLVLAGEWMPVTVYKNEQGRFVKIGMPALNGFWETLAVADMNGDGKPDIIAGNYGLNSKLHATLADPLTLYLKDFDENGQMDRVLTYRSKGKEYPFLGKDEMERAIPGIQKKYLLYRDYAGRTVQELFGDELRNSTQLHAQTMASGIFFNQGADRFAFMPLPKQNQVSPLFALLPEDINRDGKTDLLSGGNFYGVTPYEGRYDADWGSVLLNDSNHGFTWISPVLSGMMIRGELRALKKIHRTSGDIILGVRTKDPPVFFKSTLH